MQNSITKTHRLKQHFILGFFILSCYLWPSHQNLKFKSLNLLDGLSQSHVQCIARDTLGFMWFGTEDGLNRYDGYQFKTYRHNPDDSTSISSNYISTLITDSNGNLWIGTDGGGHNRYDPERDCFVRYVVFNNKQMTNNLRYIRSMISDHAGDLWIGYDSGGLVNFSPETHNFHRYGMEEDDLSTLSYDDVWTICEDRHHRIWVGTMGGGVSVVDRETQTFKHYIHDSNDPKSISHDEIWSIYEDHQNNIWIGTYGGGLNLYHPDSDNFTRYQHDPKDPSSISDNVVFSMLEDSTGRFWIGTENGGLNLFDRHAGTFYSYQHNINNPHSISHNSVECLTMDPFGTLWMGTYNGGVNYYSPYLWKFSHYKRTEGHNSLSNNAILCFYQDHNHNIWIGTDGGGLNHFDKKTDSFHHFRYNASDRTSLSDDIVLSIFEDKKNTLWLGTYNGGLNRYDPKNGRFIHYKNDPENENSISDNDIRAIYQDSYGDFWIGTNNGLNEFDEKTGKFKRYYYDDQDSTSISYNSIYLIFEDCDHNLWFGSYGRGLNLYNRENDSFINFLNNSEDITTISNNFILSIYEDHKNRLWIGTAGGLNQFQKETHSFARFRIPDGLPNDVINGILEDDEGYLWLSTNNGLSRIHPEMRKVQNFTFADGLQSNEFSPNACLKSQEKDLYFGGVNGFNLFKPEEILENPFPPHIVLTDFKIFNQPVAIAQDSPLKKHISMTDKITLSYKHNVIAIEFTALNYILPEKNLYKYTLEGFEDQWNFAQKNRTATYTNLDPGEYLFRVIASNNDNVWNETGISLKMIIRPPIWGTLWFRLLVIVIMAGLIVLIYFAQTKAIKQRNQQLVAHNQQLNQQMTARIAAEKKIQKLNTELELRVQKRTAQLENALSELESFSYSVSHDLRAPLRSIDGFNQILEENLGRNIKPEVRQTMQRIRKATQRMSALIDDLLCLAKITRKDIHIKTINLSDMIQHIFGEQMQHHVDIQPEIIIQSNLKIKGDKELLLTVLENLVSNAIKYSSKTDNPKIEFGKLEKSEAKKAGVEDMTVFYIKDNGAGFDMNYAEKLFSPFQRLHHTDEFEGTGIGLATVQRIIHLHGGDVWAESEVNKGATFYFSL